MLIYMRDGLHTEGTYNGALNPRLFRLYLLSLFLSFLSLFLYMDISIYFYTVYSNYISLISTRYDIFARVAS